MVLRLEKTRDRTIERKREKERERVEKISLKTFLGETERIIQCELLVYSGSSECQHVLIKTQQSVIIR